MLQVRCAQPILARRLYDVCVEHTQFYEETKVDTKRTTVHPVSRIFNCSGVVAKDEACYNQGKFGETTV